MLCGCIYWIRLAGKQKDQKKPVSVLVRSLLRLLTID